MTILRVIWRRVPYAAWALLLAASGCGDGSLNPVHGQVLCDGRPAAGAVVFFHLQRAADAPADPPENQAGMSGVPSGKVEKDGSFELTTDGRGRGAPAGRYVATVCWIKPSGGSDSNDQDLLPARYFSPATSGLVVEIREGDNKLAPFQLSSR